MISGQQGRSLGLCLLALLPCSAVADRIFWGCTYGAPQVLRSGRITCRREVRQMHDHDSQLQPGDRTLFTVDDFADWIAASDDGQYIVGLSNRGSENAFWIRSSQGKVIERK